jgi:hydrogenase maturation protease
MTIHVLGIGQSMRGDDAVGLEIVKFWQEKFPQTAQLVQVEFTEQPGPELLELFKEMDSAIIVDAIYSPAQPGTIIRLETDDLLSFTSDTKSSHGWGISETLHLGYSLYPWLSAVRIILIGIVALQFEQGAGISSQVSSAIASTVQMLENEVCCLLSGGGKN